jgi:hypothetical protein
MKQTIKRNRPSNKLLLATTLFATPVWSAEFTITNRTSGLTDSGLDLVYKTAINSLADTLVSQINSQLPQTSQATFLEETAKGTAIASMGAHTNYGRAPKLFLIGVSGGVGLSSGLSGLNNLAPTSAGLPNTSLGVGGSLLIGINPGSYKIIPSDRFTAFLNFGTFSTAISSVSTGFTTFGLSAQYQLVKAVGSPYLAAFNGVQVGTGYQFTNNTLAYSTNFNFSQETDLGADTVTMSWAPSFELGLSTTTHTIPIEVSTGVSFLALFELYGGFAVDLSFGSSSFTGAASGPVTATAASGAGLSTSDLFEGTGVLDLTDNSSGSPSAFSVRYFGGAAISIFGAKGFAQIQSNTAGSTAILGGFKISI